MENPWQPNHIKKTYVDVKEAFLAKEWNSFHLSRRNYISSTLRIYLNINVNYTWRNHSFHHNARSLLPTAPQTIDFIIEIGWWTSIPVPRDTRLCTFSSIMQLECPLYSPIRKKFPTLFEYVVSRTLKFVFQSNQQLNISLYLTKATTLHHSRESIGLKTSWWTFNPISHLASRTLKSISFHSNIGVWLRCITTLGPIRLLLLSQLSNGIYKSTKFIHLLIPSEIYQHKCYWNLPN